MTDPSIAQVPDSTKVVPHRLWQERLLPLMVFMTVGMTLFFLVASIAQLNSLNAAVQDSPVLDLSALTQTPTTTADEREDTLLRALLVLEGNIINRRHHEANVALMARIWTRYMGFITGMTLTMVGAAFILGRIDSSASALSGDMGKVSLELKSASPGLFMIVLGVALMVVTITNHPRIDVVDRAVFVTTMERIKASQAGASPNDSEQDAGSPPTLPVWPEVEK